MNNSEIISPNISEKPEVMPTLTSKNPNKWLKVGLLGLAGLLVAVSLIYAGYWYGTKNADLKTQNSKPQLKTQNLTPTMPAVVTSQPTLPFEPTLSPNETGKWKTYTNTIWKYEIKYPLKWYLIAPTPGQSETTTFSQLRADLEVYPLNNLSIEALPHTTLSEVQETLTNFKRSALNSWVWEKPPTTQEVNLGGRPAWKVEGPMSWVDGKMYWRKYLLVSQGPTLYEIGWFDTEDRKKEALFNQILSTLRFLE